MNMTKCFAGAVLVLWAVGGQVAKAAPRPLAAPSHSAQTPKTSPKAMHAYFRQITSLTSQFNTVIGQYTRYSSVGPYNQEEFVAAKDRKNLPMAQEGQNYLQTHSDYILKAAQLTAALSAVRVPPECRKAHAGMLNFMDDLVDTMRLSYNKLRLSLYNKADGASGLIVVPAQAHRQNKKSRQLMAQAKAIGKSLDSGPSEDLIAFYKRLEVTRKRYHLSGIYGCQLDDPPMNFQ